MHIVCPTCAAAYDVPDALLTPRRVVRCVKCAREWTPTLVPLAAARTAGLPQAALAQAQAAPEAIPPTAPKTVPPPGPESRTDPGPAPDAGAPSPAGGSPPHTVSALERLAAPRTARAPYRGSLALRAAWFLSGVALATMFVAVYMWRADIVNVWPASARVLGTEATTASPATL